MAKKLLAFLLVFVVLVSSMSTAIISVAAATDVKQTLNISVVTTKTTNDLLTTLQANYDGIKHYTTLDAALADVETNGTRGIMVLADNYPNSTTAITDAQATTINELGVRLYVEYPANNEALGITGFSETYNDGNGVARKYKMGFDRAVVMQSAAELTGMDLYSILYVHGAQFVAKTDISRSLLVNATVAGYDTVSFYDENGLTDCTPYSLLETNADSNVLICSTKFSQFITARYAPYERWTLLWQAILSWVSNDTVTSIEWTPAVNPRYSATDTLSSDAYKEAVDLNVQWYINNMLPVADGSAGIYQSYNSGSYFNMYGDPAKNMGIRADCTGESIGAIALAGVILNNQDYKDIAYNAMNWMLNESNMANGERADKTNAQYGLLSWYDDEAYEGSYYGDDNAKAILGLILGAAALETDEFDERILEAILANYRTTGVNGFRGTMLSGDNLDAKGWEAYFEGTATNYRPHFEALLWACYLWAYDKTGYEPLLTRTTTGITNMMTAYEETMKKDDDNGSGEWQWTNGMQQERAKMVWPLAWLVRIDPDNATYTGWLDTMITDMMAYQDAETGALRDAFGETGEGKGEYGPFTSNSDYGTHESPVIQENGDPCTDSLYTSSFAMVALNEAAAAMSAAGDTIAAAKYQGYAKSISDYHVRIQQVSSIKTQYNGAWCRGFDYKKWETYGSDGDAGWGIWCTETGWSQAQISAALSLQTLGTNIWEYTQGSTVNTYFNDTAELMLGEYYTEPTPSVTADVALRTGTSASQLVDDIYGSTHWGDGKWTGAEGTDITIVVDYQMNQTFDTVKLGFNQNMESGVCIPGSVTFYGSTDGVEYTEIGTYTGTTDVQAEYDNRATDGAFIERATVKSDSLVTARYVKAVIKNAGSFVKEDKKTYATWIFMDEIELGLSAYTMDDLKALIDVAAATSIDGKQPATVLAFDKAYNAALEHYNSGSANTLKLAKIYDALESAIAGLKDATDYSFVSASPTNGLSWVTNPDVKITDGNHTTIASGWKVLTDLTNLTEQEIEVILDMQETVGILSVGYSAQSYPKSGIYMQNAKYYVSDSTDGEWTYVGEVAGTAHKGDPSVAEYQTVTAAANGGEGRYVKVVFSRCDAYEQSVTMSPNRSEWLYLSEILINEFVPINVTAENATVEMVDSDKNEVTLVGAIYGKDVTVNVTPAENAIPVTVTLNGSDIEIINNSFVIENITEEQDVVLKYSIFAADEIPTITGIKDLFVTVDDVEGFDPRVDIAAYDKDGNDITSDIQIIENNIAAAVGTYTVSYKVLASNGAPAQATANVHVVDSLGETYVVAATDSKRKENTIQTAWKTSDSAQILVDGIFAPDEAGHGAAQYVTWKKTDNIEIVVALDGKTDISEIGCSLVACTEYGYYPPDIDFYVADELGGITAATEWAYIDTIEATLHTEASTYKDQIRRTIPIDNRTSGYVKVVIRYDDDEEMLNNYSTTPGKGIPEWTFVDEIIIGNDKDLKFDGASLTISDNIITNYKVEKSRVADYSNLYVKFLYYGKEYTVTDYIEEDDYYVFRFYDVAPHLMSKGIYATLYGTKDGAEYESFESVYSLDRYCYNILEKTTDDQGELRTLLVDMLNYGAASQVYKAQADSTFTYKDKEIINKDLTAQQLTWGTSTTPTVDADAQNLKYATVGNPSVKWKSGNLYLSNAVILLFTIETADVESITVNATCNGRTWAVNPDNIIATGTENRYYVYVTGIRAYEMRDTVLLTVYNGDTAVSNTISYSIEAYAAGKMNNSTVEAVDAQLVAMMRYGDSAKAYAETLAQ